MFGLSFGELLIIAVLALVLLGPDRLPEAARTLGRGLRQLHRAAEDVKGEIEQELSPTEIERLPEMRTPVPGEPEARMPLPGDAIHVAPSEPAPAAPAAPEATGGARPTPPPRG